MTDEKIDSIVQGAIRLGAYDGIRMAHRVLERFPEARKRHMFIAGGAALSSAVLIGAAMAITRRVRDGQTPEEAVNDITEEEIEGLHLLQHRRRKRDDEADDADADAALASNGAHPVDTAGDASSHAADTTDEGMPPTETAGAGPA
ncbi:MAG: hypothetical protein WD734_00685 [Dehalococcoidia bacterium]